MALRKGAVTYMTHICRLRLMSLGQLCFRVSVQLRRMHGETTLMIF